MTTNPQESRPTYARELWTVTRLVLCFVAAVAVLFAVVSVLNRFFGPAVAIIVVNAVGLVAMVATQAWWVYKSKLSDWEAQRRFECGMAPLKKHCPPGS